MMTFLPLLLLSVVVCSCSLLNLSQHTHSPYQLSGNEYAWDHGLEPCIICNQLLKTKKNSLIGRNPASLEQRSGTDTQNPDACQKLELDMQSIADRFHKEYKTLMVFKRRLYTAKEKVKSAKKSIKQSWIIRKRLVDVLSTAYLARSVAESEVADKLQIISQVVEDMRDFFYDVTRNDCFQNFRWKNTDLCRQPVGDQLNNYDELLLAYQNQAAVYKTLSKIDGARNEHISTSLSSEIAYQQIQNKDSYWHETYNEYNRAIVAQRTAEKEIARTNQNIEKHCR